MITKGDEVKVKLRKHLDESQPELQAVVTEGFCGVKRVRIVSPHPVWRGCELLQQHFRMVKREG
jgi:hypothetical protein